MMGEQYERLAPKFAGRLFDLRVGSGNVWVSDDLASVAMWEGPSSGHDSSRLADAAWERYRAEAGPRVFERLLAYERGIDAVAAPGPYWYLGVLATAPERQREGLASAVLEPVLAEADRSAVACCLETSTEDNRRFYERRGFTDAIDVPIPGAPQTWWLRRA
jgi:GNAT superfamily N-acetyltransferase